MSTTIKCFMVYAVIPADKLKGLHGDAVIEEFNKLLDERMERHRAEGTFDGMKLVRMIQSAPDVPLLEPLDPDDPDWPDGAPVRAEGMLIVYRTTTWEQEEQ